ncbi:MAG: nucleoside monophosphate kinase [Planctomycetota bacterium]|nr:nucleoside monophosphate kinase [Planctomycetota bacterium]
MSTLRQNKRPAGRIEALLLLGPTGAGKTPLGQLLEARGLGGRRCAHFDFGENLRQAVARDQPDAIVSAEDLRFLQHVLARGELLEDQDFPIAQRILRSFLARAAADANPLVVLNGLPRHVGQAAAMAQNLQLRTVVNLACSAETVLARVAANTGGDRTHRTDDDLEAIRRRLVIFAERTAPLIEYYREQDARILQLDVAADTTAAQLWEQMRGYP